jgi:hypothetical protein
MDKAVSYVFSGRHWFDVYDPNFSPFVAVDGQVQMNAEEKRNRSLFTFALDDRANVGKPWGHPLAKLRCFAAEQVEVTCRGFGLEYKKGRNAVGRGNRADIGALCPSISMVPKVCDNMIGDTRIGRVIPFGRVQGAHLRARRVPKNSCCQRRNHHEHDAPPC